MSKKIVIEEEILNYFRTAPESAATLLYKLATAEMKKRKLIGLRKKSGKAAKGTIPADSQIATR